MWISIGFLKTISTWESKTPVYLYICLFFAYFEVSHIYFRKYLRHHINLNNSSIMRHLIRIIWEPSVKLLVTLKSSQWAWLLWEARMPEKAWINKGPAMNAWKNDLKCFISISTVGEIIFYCQINVLKYLVLKLFWGFNWPVIGI